MYFWLEGGYTCVCAPAEGVTAVVVPEGPERFASKLLLMTDTDVRCTGCAPLKICSMRILILGSPVDTPLAALGLWIADCSRAVLLSVLRGCTKRAQVVKLTLY